MKKKITAYDVQLITTALCNAGIEAGEKNTPQCSFKIDFNYILNNDGSARWIFPKGMKRPEFLRFYFAGSKRASQISKIYKTFYKLRLAKLIVNGSGHFYTSSNSQGKFIQNASWCLFTGTKGPNRKMILWHEENGENIFTKIALNTLSSALIVNEKNNLSSISAKLPENIFISAVQKFSEKFLSMKEIPVTGKENFIPVKNLPVTALQNWSVHQKSSTLLTASVWWNKSIQYCNESLKHSDSRIPRGFFTKLEYVKNILEAQNVFCNTTAHGDFTPWNIFFDEEKIGMIDWELSSKGMPVLYDVFHYVYQQNILIGRKNYSSIRSELNELFAQKEWKFFLVKNAISVKYAEAAYLFYTVSYYLKLYSSQIEWHEQVQWLLYAWSEALSHVIVREKKLTARQILLLDTGIYLHNKTYGAMKMAFDNITELPESSDVDLYLPHDVSKALHQFYCGHILVKNVIKKQSSYLAQLKLNLEDGNILFVDCIHKFKRKSLEYLSGESIWRNAYTNAFGIKQAAPAADFEYVFNFYLLNNSAVPEKYIEHYRPYEKAIAEHFNKRSILMGNYEKLVDFDKKIASVHLENIRQSAMNKGVNKIKNKLLYIIDSLKSFGNNDGFIITFSGVDGAGKSTVIDYSREYIEKILRKRVVVLRHRPSVLPILSAWQHGKQKAESRSISSLPRQGTNKNTFASLLRFLYYYTDYFFGQFYVQAKYVSRGYAVLYDRYYFDMINDAKRTNIELSENFLSWWYKFLFKPELNIFLYAPAEDILKRKQELNAETINKLTDKYAGLFHSYEKKYAQSKYLAISNVEMSQTLSSLYSQIKKL